MIFTKANRGDDPQIHLAAGNIARDMREWDGAVAHYETYLAKVPEDAGIWVQLGNCAKEAGRYKTSFEAYALALRLTPSEADTHLQLGHLCKLLGRLREAQGHYRSALQLDPDLADARQELASLQNTIASLPFLLPPSFLDFIVAETPQDLVEKCAEADPLDDPFRKYAELLN
jgi:tetratricopeptide (TPR) repeat protein